jgi:hypothetical protein
MVILPIESLSVQTMHNLLAQYLRGQGGRIINRVHPEWGTWQVVKYTTHDDTPGWFDIRSARSATVVYCSNLHEWALVK